MSSFISDWPALAVKDTHPDSAAEGAVQALEISYLLTTSQSLWLYSADRLLLATMLLAGAFSTFTASSHVKTMASTRHAALGVFLSLLCIVGFIIDVCITYPVLKHLCILTNPCPLTPARLLPTLFPSLP